MSVKYKLCPDENNYGGNPISSRNGALYEGKSEAANHGNDNYDVLMKSPWPDCNY